MTFPVYIDIGLARIHPHWLFESASYAVGFWVLARLRRRGDPVPHDLRWTAVAAAIVGGAIGSKILFWLEDPASTMAHWNDWQQLMAGKSIVGGLFGGLLAVEAAKWWIGERRSTGDLFVLPLCFGMAVGRIGCFLAGLDDRTFGTPTTLPWGVDFGDGVLRHPTQLYESAFLLLVVAPMAVLPGRPHRSGDLFRLFMVIYALFRLAVDTIKPAPMLAGLSATQWAALVILVYYLRDLPRLARWVSGRKVALPAPPAAAPGR
jgi:prolipoprotein diacylglyceryltransferase